MNDVSEILVKVREALGGDPRVAPDLSAIATDFRDGDLTMTGEVATIAAKKLALEHGAAVPGVDHVVDRLRVVPSERMEDGQIRDLIRDALLQEPALSECALREWVKGRLETVRSPAPARGCIDIRVANGVVTLDGDVPGLSRKRLAGSWHGGCPEAAMWSTASA